MSETTVAATIAVDMLRFLERRGHPLDAVCREAGLDPTIVTRLDDRIPGSCMAVLWDVAVARTGDPLVAVQMSEEFHPAALDILGYVVLTCSTIGDAVECLARYAGLLNDGLRVVLDDHGTTVVLRIEITTSMRRNHLTVHSHHVVLAMWTGLARQLRGLSATPVLPLAVRFRHVMDDGGVCQRVLRAPVQFGADEDQFVLARSDLARPLLSANPALFSVFEHHANIMLAGLELNNTLAGRVARIIAERMKGRKPTIDEVAVDLAMSARNLQRELQAEGRTYQQILDDVRSGLARQYLADDANTVSQVAFLLGFSEPAAFHRAFKKWTGVTPAAARTP